MYRILIVPEAVDELNEIPTFHRRQVEEAIDKKLKHEPTKETQNRKCLRSVVAGFEFEPPLWELRVGEWRVFYDVEEKTVIIRAIRKKPSSKRTEDIL